MNPKLYYNCDLMNIAIFFCFQVDNIKKDVYVYVPVSKQTPKICY